MSPGESSSLIKLRDEVRVGGTGSRPGSEARGGSQLSACPHTLALISKECNGSAFELFKSL